MKKTFTIPQYSSLSKVMNLCFLITLICAVFPTNFSAAQGDLLIMPKRVVFEGGKRSENLNLANIGKDTATYVISLVHVKMKEDGSFEKITEPEAGQAFADDYLRIFPRTVTLAPNEAQAVKVQLTRTNELAPGEYRSHLYFRAIHNPQPLGEPSKSKDTTVSVRITPVFGISIPAIIRVGESNASVNISDASFDVEKDTIPVVKLAFNRSGNMSVYGDVTIEHISGYGKITKVASIKGIAVYSPNARRYLKMRLDRNAGADLTGGKLKISYTDQTPKNNILAQQEILLN